MQSSHDPSPLPSALPLSVEKFADKYWSGRGFLEKGHYPYIPISLEKARDEGEQIIINNILSTRRLTYLQHSCLANKVYDMEASMLKQKRLFTAISILFAISSAALIAYLLISFHL